MTTWLRTAPGITRVAALAGAAMAVALAAHALGTAIDWGTAIIYGIALAVAMRWPIVMPGTGSRLVLVFGLLLEAVWHHGLPTGLVLLLVEFAARMVVLNQGRYYWEWYRPLFPLAAISVAYALSLAASGGVIHPVHGMLPRIDTAGLTLAYGYWGLINAAWAVVRAPRRGSTRTEEYLRRLVHSWWVPLAFIAIAWPMELVRAVSYPLEAAACLALLWVQAQVGPIFTTLHQDRAVADMVRQAPAQSPAQRLTAHRVLQVANALAQAMSLSAHDLRLVGYAALLQEVRPPHEPEVPLWLSGPPSPTEREAVRRRLEESLAHIERDGVLQAVADLLRYRYAAYDGQGYPAVSGDAIPVSSMVLAAANALVQLTAPEVGGAAGDLAQAARWLRNRAASRIGPRVIGAVTDVYLTTRARLDASDGLPETVRQLQGLLAGQERPTSFAVGMRRLWLQARGKVGLVPDLPPEVQAVARLATLFAASTDAVRTAEIIVEAVGRLVGGKVALAVVDGEDPLLMRFKASHGFQHMNLTGSAIAVMGGHMSRAILNQSPVQVADLREMNSALAHEIARAEAARSVLFVPMAGRGQTFGLLMVVTQSYHWFTPQEVGLIHLMAGQGAMALENARLIAEAAERLERISRMKAFTDALLDNLSISIIVTDPEGRLVVSNAAARTWLGGSALQEGMPLPPEVSVACCVERALAGESMPERDVPWGSNILEVTTIPLQNEHGVMQGAICLVRDVTQVRMMEQQVRRVEKMAAVGELAAGAAHEIRNPLTAIRGFIQLLQARTAATGDEYYRIIIGEIDRIDGIIRDLLLLARPAELERVPMALAGVLDELLMLNEAEYKRQGVAVVRAYDLAVGPVPVDPKMFRQLLLNLVMNAAQAMPFGGFLKLALRRLDEAHIVLEVTDTGVGIAPEHLERLFVPFFTTKEEGTGLGLALCYSIVQAHQGRIDVDSRVGLGTTFAITLPLEE
jgi:signal transduction histidine kinase